MPQPKKKTLTWTETLLGRGYASDLTHILAGAGLLTFAMVGVFGILVATGGLAAPAAYGALVGIGCALGTVLLGSAIGIGQLANGADSANKSRRFAGYVKQAETELDNQTQNMAPQQKLDFLNAKHAELDKEAAKKRAAEQTEKNKAFAALQEKLDSQKEKPKTWDERIKDQARAERPDELMRLTSA